MICQKIMLQMVLMFFIRKNKNGIMKIGSYSRKLVGICIKSIKSSSQTSLFDWRALTKKIEEKGWYSGLLLHSKKSFFNSRSKLPTLTYLEQSLTHTYHGFFFETQNLHCYSSIIISLASAVNNHYVLSLFLFYISS